jgi:hypothetical protein
MTQNTEGERAAVTATDTAVAGASGCTLTRAEGTDVATALATAVPRDTVTVRVVGEMLQSGKGEPISAGNGMGLGEGYGGGTGYGGRAGYGDGYGYSDDHYGGVNMGSGWGNGTGKG